MRTRCVAVTLLAACQAVAALPAASAQSATAAAEKRIVVVATRGERLAEGTPTDRAFRAELAARGWRDGTLRVEHRDLAALDELPSVAAALSHAAVDVVVAAGTMQAMALAREVRATPIVTAVADPVGFGFARSDLRPAANVTGTALPADYWQKKVELLRATLPVLTRLYIIADPGYDAGWPVESTSAAAHARGIDTQVVQARTLDDLRDFLERTPPQGAALIVMNSPSLARAIAQPLAAFGRTHRIAVLAPYALYARAGALMAYEEDGEFRARRVAVYVDRILRGARPADLPFERVEEPRITINATTAAAIGVTIPKSILDGAAIVQ